LGLCLKNTEYYKNEYKEQGMRAVNLEGGNLVAKSESTNWISEHLLKVNKVPDCGDTALARRQDSHSHGALFLVEEDRPSFPFDFHSLIIKKKNQYSESNQGWH
jgi:hypothetical protein